MHGVDPSPHPVIRAPGALVECTEMGKLNACDLLCRLFRPAEVGVAPGADLHEFELLLGSRAASAESILDDLESEQPRHQIVECIAYTANVIAEQGPQLVGLLPHEPVVGILCLGG